MWKMNIYFKYTGVSYGDQGQEHSWASEGSGSHIDLPLSVSPLLYFSSSVLHCRPALLAIGASPPPHSDWKVAILKLLDSLL